MIDKMCQNQTPLLYMYSQNKIIAITHLKQVHFAHFSNPNEISVQENMVADTLEFCLLGQWRPNDVNT